MYAYPTIFILYISYVDDKLFEERRNIMSKKNTTGNDRYDRL